MLQFSIPWIFSWKYIEERTNERKRGKKRTVMTPGARDRKIGRSRKIRDAMTFSSACNRSAVQFERKDAERKHNEKIINESEMRQAMRRPTRGRFSYPKPYAR